MEQKNSHLEEEIDLLSYLDSLKKAMAPAKKFLVKIRRNLLLFLGITALGVALAYYVKINSPRYYETKAMYVLNGLPADYAGKLMVELQENIAGNPPLAASYLNIPEKELEKVILVEGWSEKGDFLPSNTDSTPSLLQVKLRVSDTTVVSAVEKNIPDYLANAPFSQKIIAAKRNSLDSLKKNIETSIRKTDSLRESSSTLLSAENRAQQLEALLLLETRYQQKISDIHTALQQMDKPELAIPFVRKLKPDSPGTNKKFMLMVLASLAIAALVIFLLPTRRQA